MTNEELWGLALIEIELAVSRANFVTWFKDTRILDFAEGTVTVGVPNGFSKEWLENKFHKFILKSLRTRVPEIRAINYSIATPSTSAATKIKFKKELPPPQEEQLEFKDFYVDPKTNLNPKYTLDTFVVGSFNELAHAAALAVIKSLGRVYNLKEKYREFDLLIVDDVQFFAGKTKTQEEFFYTFNTLYEAGKQVVFSSDRSPKSISDIGERLQSRMEAGVIIDISEPEYESRLAILKSKILEKKIDLPESTIELMALLIHKNIRELEGALNTINIQSKYQNRALTQDEVRVILSKNIKPKNAVTPTQIIKTVAEFYDIQEKAIYEHTRKTEVVKPRQVAMYLIREDLKWSYPFIGQK